MGHFFFGAVIGLLFSSVLYIVLLAAGYPRRMRWDTRWFWTEFAGAALIVVLIVGTTFIWSPADLDWVRRQLIPIKLVQILLGIGTGVFARLWLTRLFLTYLELEAGKPAAAKRSREEKKAELEETDSENSANKKASQQKGQRPTGYEVALGFLAIVVIAVLMPYLEDMIRKAASIKIGSVEVIVKSEQKSQNLATLTPSRESQATAVLVLEAPDSLALRLASDERRQSDARIRAAVVQSNAQYLAFYRNVLYPFLNCLKGVFNQGWDNGVIRDDLRTLTHALLVASRSSSNDAAIQADLKLVATTADAVMRKWSRVDPSCRSLPNDVATGGPKAAESFMFHWLVSDLLSFAGDQLSAVQALERVRTRFQDNELNWASRVAALYYDQDRTLTRSVEHYGDALRIAQASFDSAHRKVTSGPLRCPAAKTDPKETQDTCYDFKRYRDAIGRYKNNIAYAQALSGRYNLSVASQFAKEALTQRRDEIAPNSQSTDETYRSRLDTYTYVTMIASARSSTPDPKILACAGLTFAKLAEQAYDALLDSMKRTNDPDFRTTFLGARYTYEIFSSHRALAAQLAEREKGECRETDREYRRMQTGDL
jgi:hypothetical protein